ncbi:MAG: serine/threonine-protein kinase [Myxococcota bacterium]
MTDRLPDGTIFGTYTIEGLIASGGMGQVYAARHNVYGSAVALKVLHPALHADESWRARFNEEGLVGTQLKHPHVLSARELVHNDGRIALVVDLVQGGQTLEKVVSREFRDGVALVPALTVFLKILQGMDYLHGKGIVHGDLKPENVMIEGDFRRPETWVPKVTDFGTVALIAHPVEIDGRPAVVATPRYASPEHLYGVDQIEVRSDIYTLALILHFLLSGRHASNATNVREAADRVLLPVPIVNLVDQPEPLVEVFKRASATNPDDRFESVRAMALAIRGVLSAVGAELELPDVAADLATEVDEDRAKQRRQAGSTPSGGVSQAATEREPTGRGTRRTPPPGPQASAGASGSSSPSSARGAAAEPTADPPPAREDSQRPSASAVRAVTVEPLDERRGKPKSTPVPISAAGRGVPAPKPIRKGLPWFVLPAAGLAVVLVVVIAALVVLAT